MSTRAHVSPALRDKIVPFSGSPACPRLSFNLSLRATSPLLFDRFGALGSSMAPNQDDPASPWAYPREPSLKNLTSPEWGRPRPRANPATQSLGQPHVESFNFMMGPGLDLVVQDLKPLLFRVPQTEERIALRITEAHLMAPSVVPGSIGVKEPRVFPTEARQRGITYKGRLNISPAELVAHGEHEEEWGGYFIVGGHERIIRMLQTTRRNYPIAMQRPSWKKRGRNFSDLGVLLECGKSDLTTNKNVLHFVTSGTSKFMFNFGKELFFVPVVMILKCLCTRSDASIYQALIAGTEEDDFYYRGCLKNMLAEPQEEGLFSSEQVRQYIGRVFRDKMSYIMPDWYTDEEACDFLIDRAICIHLNNNEDKFNMIVLMVKKLFALVQDKCVVEGVDSVMMHEIVVGGHLYLQLIKEKLEMWMTSLKANILKRTRGARGNPEVNPEAIQLCANRTITLEKMFENFLGTGNLPSQSGLGLMQDSGLTIMAENINRMRYMSHFRAIHRGSFFQEMRTTEVRALLPDAWGFVCPVHTPDGAPCGLLNHLTMPAEIVTHVPDASKIPQVLVNLGMHPLGEVPEKVMKSCYHVVLNGKVLGFVARSHAQRIADKLRVLKIQGDRVPKVTEIVLIAAKSRAAQFPGMFIFTGAARMMRPVLNLSVNEIELIGTFEQVFMDICITQDEAYKGLTTHQEIRATSFLSNLACTIPLPDFNQSPRNMYQCQMGKQTMASPMHTWHLNSETKMYRLQTPSSPFFRPAHYDHIKLDDFPMGTNAIVAVISYTGYDMEDAMIINKSSFERGFAAGSIYKSMFVDLREQATGRKNSQADCVPLLFARDPKNETLGKFLDLDGLPHIGVPLHEGDPLYSYCNTTEGTYVVKRYEGKEMVFVDAVKICSNDTGTSERNRICISLRIPRNPSVGDKFASRAGQKGICSQKWPTEDLPWTESGLFPDIVFNPHGFPSRMTIAMMIECMAGKSGAVHGLCHDATPFVFGETSHGRVDAIDFFARQLEKAGYNYYGTETLYSGTDGVEMKADIFFGIIHYQRLRHMVSDKFQVRSVGTIDQVTRQPIKGRRRGGGVRFGEMERDSLLSHGTMFLLQDRLFHGSDKARVKICTECGSLLSPRVVIPLKANSTGVSRYREHHTKCVICDRFDCVKDIQLPYIFLHLVSQLAAVNIKIKVQTKQE
eukprot:TCALIF_00602-PA protein Name:"Similar to POLR1B DNA-directed RNA polymerase I subunit RPA2 (Pongo abelii)" AED:0.03 eAED:0.03 QI:23/0.66/0.75/1/0.66/1/4/44/1177